MLYLVRRISPGLADNIKRLFPVFGIIMSLAWAAWGIYTHSPVTVITGAATIPLSIAQIVKQHHHPAAIKPGH
jgi:hypothetical protein